jgi:hypothetical protein
MLFFGFFIGRERGGEELGGEEVEAPRERGEGLGRGDDRDSGAETDQSVKGGLEGG